MATGPKPIAEALQKALRHGGMDSTQLAAIVTELDALHGQGIPISRVLTKGIPRPDMVVAESMLNEQELLKLVPMLPRISLLRALQVFPNGIPNVEMFRAELTLG